MKNNLLAIASEDIHASPSKVWEALTNPELIKLYFFGTETITDWKVGSPILFKGIWDGKEYLDKGIILEIEPEKLLQYNYLSSFSGLEDKAENYAIITYSLIEVGGGTKLTITQANIASEEAQKHSEQNWGMVLKGLKELLEKKTVAS